MKDAVQKMNQKNKTAVNFVKPKRNRKMQFLCKTENENQTEVIFCQLHTPKMNCCEMYWHQAMHL